MSDTADDELLGGEDELDDVYDISPDREDVLLQDEDDFKSRDFYERKKVSESESDEQDDVLNLHVDEDFQDEDKLLYEEEEEEEPPTKDIKITVENTQATKSNAKSVVQVTTKNAASDKRPGSDLKKPIVEHKGNYVKKNDLRNDMRHMNMRRKRGNGRGSFQPRSNFGNNNMARRRNGTVLINPRYEGTVHVSDNNARLKWDNAPYPPQNHYVQPWNGGGNVLLANRDANLQNQLLTVVSGLANSLVHSPPNLSVPPPPLAQNFYRPPCATNYEQPLAFEPPPHIVEEQQQYGAPPPQNQVSNHQILQPVQSTYTMENQHQPYNNQMTDRRMRDSQTYNSYTNYNHYDGNNRQQNTELRDLNRTNSYVNKNSYDRYDNNTSRPYNNYSTQNNFQNPSVNYTNDDYQSNSDNYSDYHMDQGNYSNNEYNYNNERFNRNDTNQTNQDFSYRQDPKPHQTNNFTGNVQNNFSEQNEYRNSPNQSVVPQRNNTPIPNRNFGNQGHRRPAMDNYPGARDAVEKRPRFNQDNKSGVRKYNEEEEHGKMVEKQAEATKKITPDEDEDEETRLYRLKIEEQKRERERILAIKEERRKQMMLEKIQHEEEKLPDVETRKPTPHPNLSKTFNKPPLFTKKHKLEQSVGAVSVQTANQNGSFQSANFTVQNRNQFPTSAPSRNQADNFAVRDTQVLLAAPSRNFQPPQQQQQQQSAAIFPRQFSREIKVEFPTPSYQQQQQQQQQSTPRQPDFPNLTFKIANDRPSSNNVPKELPKVEASSSSFMSNRVVVVKNRNQARGVGGEAPMPAAPVSTNYDGASEDVGQNVSSFFNSRKVLKKDSNLLNTRLVVVSNLSANVNRSKLEMLCAGIGEIQNLRVDTQERQATILFKSVASAHAFFKKNQRRILDDLSVIEVKLESML